MSTNNFFILLSIFSLQLIAIPAFADCQASRQDAEHKVEQISSQMRGASTCVSNKLTVQALEINIEYLDACPEADPDGDQRQNVLVSLDYAKIATSATCS